MARDNLRACAGVLLSLALVLLLVPTQVVAAFAEGADTAVADTAETVEGAEGAEGGDAAGAGAEGVEEADPAGAEGVGSAEGADAAEEQAAEQPEGDEPGAAEDGPDTAEGEDGADPNIEDGASLRAPQLAATGDSATDDWLDGLSFGSRPDRKDERFVAYPVEPEFDPEVHEYTVYIPDNVSGIYGAGVSLLAAGGSTNAFYAPTATYKGVDGKDQKINLSKNISSGGLTYLTGLIKRGAYANDITIHCNQGTADYAVHVRRIVTLSSLMAQVGDGTPSDLYEENSTEYEFAVPLNCAGEKLNFTPQAYYDETDEELDPKDVPYQIRIGGQLATTGEVFAYTLAGGEEDVDVEVSWEDNRSTVYSVHVMPADAGGSVRFAVAEGGPEQFAVKLFNSHGTQIQPTADDPNLFEGLFAGSEYSWSASSEGWRTLHGSFKATRAETNVALEFSEHSVGRYLDELWVYPNSSGAISGNYATVRDESLDEMFNATVYTVTYSSQLTSQSCYLAAMLSQSAPDGAKIKARAWGLNGTLQEITLPDSESGLPIRRAFKSKVFDVGIKRAIIKIEVGKGDDIERYVVLVKRDLQLMSLSVTDPSGKELIEDKFRRSIHDYDAGVSYTVPTVKVTATPFEGLEDATLTVDGMEMLDGVANVTLTEEHMQDIRVELSQEYAYEDPEYEGISYKSSGLYTVHMERLYPVNVRFATDPEDAIVAVYDRKGVRVEGSDASGKVYQGIYRGRTYTYTVTRNGCKGVKGTFVAQEGLVVDVSLDGAPTQHPELSGMEWWNYRNSSENNGVTSATTPDSASVAALKWQVSLGLDYNSSCTPPLVGGGYVFTAAGKYVYKLDKNTGEVLAVSDELVGDAAYALNAMTYAEGMLFVQVGNGRIQAVSATTLRSLWVSEKIGGQTLSPITYRDGYLFSGTWNSESRAGEYFCLSVTDEDPERGDEVKYTSWRYSHTGGYYWAGAYATERCLVFGSDDGVREGESANTAVLYSVNPRTGVAIDKITNIEGDIRSSIVYDDGYVYFCTKGGMLYRIVLEADGTFGASAKLDLGGASTSSPVVYKGRVYVGVCGEGGQYNTDGGHSFVVARSDAGGLSRAYAVETPGYPQAAALVSTGYAGKDYDVDDKPDGRVYAYFTCNARPGGIFMLADEPNATDGELVELFTPDSARQQFCISPICCDGEGTLYFKNDSGYMFAVSANDAYLIDAELVPDTGTAFWDEEFDSGRLGYRVMVDNAATSTTLTLKVPAGRKVIVDGVAYKEGMSVPLPGDGSIKELALVVTFRGKQRTYTLQIEPRGTDPSLSELFAGKNNNALQLGARLAFTPAFEPETLEYEAAEAAREARFVNLWAVPTGRYSTIEVEGVSGVSKINVFRNAVGSYGRTRYAVYFGPEESRATVQVNVTAGDGVTKRSYTVVLTRPDIYPPKVDDAIGHRLSGDDAAVLFNANEAGRYCYVVTDADAATPERPSQSEELELSEGAMRIDLSGIGPEAHTVWIWTVDEQGNRSEAPERVDIAAYQSFEASFAVKPADAELQVTDALGEPVAIAGSGGTRTATLVDGNVYTLTATREGHAQFTERFTADAANPARTVELVNLRSTDSSLKGLFVSSSAQWKAGLQKLSPEFAASVTRYEAGYPGERSHLNVWPVVSDSKASVSVYAMSGVRPDKVAKDETIPLSDADGRRYWKVYFDDGVYEAQVRVHVVAEDKSATDYFLTLRIEDTTKPALARVSSSRISAAKASVVFKASEVGTYFFAVAKKGKKAPKAAKLMRGAGVQMIAGTNTVPVEGLGKGAYVVYVVGVDPAGNESKVLAIPVKAPRKKAADRAKESKGSKGSGGSGSGGGSDSGDGSSSSRGDGTRTSTITRVRYPAGASTPSRVRASAGEGEDASAVGRDLADVGAAAGKALVAPSAGDFVPAAGKSNPREDGPSGFAQMWQAVVALPWWAKALLVFAGLGLLYLLFWVFSVVRRKRQIALAFAKGRGD